MAKTEKKDKMVRRNHHYPAQLIERLERHRDQVGLSVADIIRRAIDEYLRRNKA